MMGQACVVVTGSCGLIGSEVCLHFHRAKYSVLGIDNNQRAVFFGPEGDTSRSLQRLRQDVPGYEHHEIDIRDREAISIPRLTGVLCSGHNEFPNFRIRHCRA